MLGHVLELGEDSGCWSVVRHDPQGQEESKEAEDVSEENDAFCKRQMVCKEDVEADGQHHEQEDDERGLP